MYSVEDLLISHGYKISSNNNVPSSHSSSSHEQRPPTHSNSRCEITEKRTGHGAVNGYKADSVYGGGVKQTSSRGGPSDTEIQDKNQRTEEDNANLVDRHSPGGTLTSDSGLVKVFYSPILLSYTLADSRTYTTSPHFSTLVFIFFQLRFKLAGVDEACYVMVAAIKDFSSVVGQNTSSVLSFVQSVSLFFFISFLFLCVIKKHKNNFIVLGIHLGYS